MKYKTSILTGVAALGLLAATSRPAQAGSISFGISVGGCLPQVVVTAPPPIVVPAPPRVVHYVPPRLVYPPPAPVVYVPHGHGRHFYQHQHKAYHRHVKHWKKHHRHDHHPAVYRIGHAGGHGH